LWLGTIALVWGSTMIGMGFVKDWNALAGNLALKFLPAACT